MYSNQYKIGDGWDGTGWDVWKCGYSIRGVLHKQALSISERMNSLLYVGLSVGFGSLFIASIVLRCLLVLKRTWSMKLSFAEAFHPHLALQRHPWRDSPEGGASSQPQNYLYPKHPNILTVKIQNSRLVLANGIFSSHIVA